MVQLLKSLSWLLYKSCPVNVNSEGGQQAGPALIKPSWPVGGDDSCYRLYSRKIKVSHCREYPSIPCDVGQHHAQGHSGGEGRDGKRWGPPHPLGFVVPSLSESRITGTKVHGDGMWLEASQGEHNRDVLRWDGGKRALIDSCWWLGENPTA